MMLLCALPILIILFSGEKLFSAGYAWPILIGVFVIAHVGMMLRGRHAHDSEHSNEADGDGSKDNMAHPAPDEQGAHKKKHGGCC